MTRTLGRSLGLIVLGGWLACAATASADTIYVDAVCGDDANMGVSPACGDDEFGPRRTIQAAIEVAHPSHDEIVVARGTYYETIDFDGKSITIRSAEGPEHTIIDAGGVGACVTFVMNENADTRLQGFTLTGGTGRSVPPLEQGGGAIYISQGADPTIVDCVLVDNTAPRGGGVYIGDSSLPTLVNCVLLRNTATWGGGIYVAHATPADAFVTNCTIARNTATDNGGGILVYQGDLRVANCVVWDNEPNPIYEAFDIAHVEFSDVEGGHSGSGNINLDPLFLEPGGDLRLAHGSPCIDAGEDGAVPVSVTTDPDGNDRLFDMEHPGYNHVDMGAYEHGYIANVRTSRTCTSFPVAFAAAEDGDVLRADLRAFTHEPVIDYAGRPVTVRSTGAVTQPPGSDLVMADDSSLATSGGLEITLSGELDVPAGARATLEADEVIVSSSGIATLAPASVIEVVASSGMTCDGGLTVYGGAMIADDGLDVSATGWVTGYGDLVGPITIAGNATWLADVQVVGSYVTTGTTTVQGGTLTVIGPLTATGSLLGGVGEGGPAAVETVVAVFGDLDAAADATLRMPGPGQRVTVTGDWDVAIDANTRYDMAGAELWMNATGGVQTLELMSLDQGNSSLGLDRFLPGAYPIGQVRVGPGATTVELADVHDNDGLGQASCEALYVEDLIIDAGATLNTNGCRVYYRTLVFLGSVDSPANLVEIDDTPIVACPGDTDGDDDVDVNDLNNVILDWGTDGSANGGDVTGDNVVNVDDLVDVIVFWGPCEPS